LDVVIFSPLATAYSNALDGFLRDSLGFTYMTKRHFWRLFAVSWDKALTEENITKAFESPGIWPVNGSKVLDILRTGLKTPDNDSDTQPRKRTSTGVLDLRRTVKMIRKKAMEITEEMELVIKASEKLAFEKEVLEHDNMRLKQAAALEKTRRKKGKPYMGLFEPDCPGQAQFFSPSKIAAVRERLKAREGENERQRKEKEERQLQKAIEREERAQEAQERREAAQRKREAKAVERRAEQERKEVEKAARKAKKATDRQVKEEEKVRKAGRGGRRGRLGRDRDESTISEVDSHDPHDEELCQNWIEFVENCPANAAAPLERSESELSQNATMENVNVEDLPRKQVTLRSGRVATLPARYK